MTQNNEREKLDVRYFNEKLRLVLEGLQNYTRSELSRELQRLSNTASPISQNEQQEPIALLALKNTELNRRIEVLEDLLASAAVISLRRGEDTHWDRFIAQLKIKGICFVTPKTFKILPSDEEYASPHKQAIPDITVETKLPFDIYFGKGKVGKGCTLNTLIKRISAQSNYVDELISENEELCKKLGIPSRRELFNQIINAAPTNTEVGE